MRRLLPLLGLHVPSPNMPVAAPEEQVAESDVAHTLDEGAHKRLLPSTAATSGDTPEQYLKRHRAAVDSLNDVPQQNHA